MKYSYCLRANLTSLCDGRTKSSLYSSYHQTMGKAHRKNCSQTRVRHRTLNPLPSPSFINHMTSTGLQNRIKQEKKLLLEHLEKTPIVQIACEKSGVGRSTYYRWMQSDKAFAKASREALSKWVAMMNDLAESQLLKAVKDGNMSAIAFWLRSRHTSYSNKLEIVDIPEREELTKEQKEIVRRVLKAYQPKE